MLETVDITASLSKEEYQQALEKLDLRLGELQREIREAGIPVVVVFEGWSAAGKGTVMSRLLYPLDPRGYKVFITKPPTEEELFRPSMRRFWLSLPADGWMTLYDRSWYIHALDDRAEHLTGKAEWQAAYDRIRTFERQLTDDGAVIVKFWLHISKAEQAKRFKKLRKDPALAWRVTKADLRQHDLYGKYAKAAEAMFEETSTPNAPWTIVPSHDRHYAIVQVAETLAAALENALAVKSPAKTTRPAERKQRVTKRRTSMLDRVDLSLALSPEEYDSQLPALQQELRRMEHLIYIHRIPVVVVYEGWDAAGKGGNIRRMTRDLDPRGYEVIPIAAPQGEERTHHYLWRFWKQLPKAGHINLFDRSWYGRVLVERIEGFARPDEWQRAYQEINEFERDLTDYGAALVKFWLHISPEEQLKRFRQRQEISYKKWKITDEDWRNRKRWADYYLAVSDMIERTSTLHAPWTVVEANDKLHARVKTLRTVIETIKRALARHGKKGAKKQTS